MSIQNNFPAIKPTLLLDFANTKQLDPRITFTRASTATYYGTQTAVAEQNGLLQSQDFATTWNVSGTSVTSNTSTAPDSTLTADTVTEDTSNSFHIVSQGGLANLSNAVGTMTLSVFAKLGTGTRYLTIGLSTDIVANNGSATFDLSAGTNTQTQNNGTWTSASATITAVAQGFYRCTLTVTTDSVGAGLVRIGLNSTSTPTTTNRGFGADYVGDGTSSIIVWGAQVEKRSAASAYTPTTTQPIINYIPVLQTAASGVARFDHNPVTDESLGLLIEESRTNTYTNSNIPTSLAATNITLSAAFPALDPTQTFTLGQENTINTEHFFADRSFTPVVGTTYAFSVYAKQGPGTRNLLMRIAGGNIGTGTFNLQTGAVVNFGGVASSAIITPVGNGVYRCTTIWTATSTTSTVVRLQFMTSAGATVYAGDGYSGISVWGAQHEVGAFATSYIPTVASQVTRATDAASMTGTNFSSWYNQSEGMLYAQFNAPNTEANTRIVVGASDGTTSKWVLIAKGTSNRAAYEVYDGVGAQASISSAVDNLVNTLGKAAFAHKLNDFAASTNGQLDGTDTSGTLPIVTQLNIGDRATGSRQINGQIRKIAYYPLRVTNAQLQALTS